MKFSKIKTPSLKESCVDQLMGKILSGELQAGEYLPPERELAEVMGVSRSIVNQSVMELESNGFLEVQPRRGTLVRDYRKHPTPQSLAALMHYGGLELDYSIFSDLMATRLLLEEECAALACNNAYESTLREMEELLDRLTEETQDPTDILFSFHYKLTQASGNGVYAMIFRGFEPVLRALIHRHYCDRNTDLQQAAQQRREFLEILRRHDAAKARVTIRDILTEGMSALEQAYTAQK